MFKETRALKLSSDFLCCTYRIIHQVLCYLNFSTLYRTFTRRTSGHTQRKFSVECNVWVSRCSDSQVERQMYLWEPTQLHILLIPGALSLGIKRLWLQRFIPKPPPWRQSLYIETPKRNIIYLKTIVFRYCAVVGADIYTARIMDNIKEATVFGWPLTPRVPRLWMSGVVPPFYVFSWFEKGQLTPPQTKRRFCLSTLLRITNSFIQGSGHKVIYSTDF
jgi:hypothetical protein